MKISIIIPTFNGKGLLADCLGSIAKLGFSPDEVIVVDNGSTDGSINLVKKKFPHFKIITLDKNYGFAKAVNEGIRASESEYVVLLNNDCKVESNWLGSLVEAAQDIQKSQFLLQISFLGMEGRLTVRELSSNGKERQSK